MGPTLDSGIALDSDAGSGLGDIWPSRFSGEGRGKGRRFTCSGTASLPFFSFFARLSFLSFSRSSRFCLSWAFRSAFSLAFRSFSVFSFSFLIRAFSAFSAFCFAFSLSFSLAFSLAFSFSIFFVDGSPWADWDPNTSTNSGVGVRGGVVPGGGVARLSAVRSWSIFSPVNKGSRSLVKATDWTGGLEGRSQLRYLYRSRSLTGWIGGVESRSQLGHSCLNRSWTD